MDASKVRFRKMFDVIFATDLIFEQDCWKQCVDGHCCHFTRYKTSRDRGFQEIPLLPGEWDYMKEKGYLNLYPNTRRSEITLNINAGPVRYESICIETEGCPCTHDFRPTVCRLYPLLPEFSPEAGVTGVDPFFTIYDVIEENQGLPRACRVSRLPFSEVHKFLTIASAIAREPVVMFHVMSYSIAKSLFHTAIRESKLWSRGTADPDRISEICADMQLGLISGKLIEWATLKARLHKLSEKFASHYGEFFSLE